MAKETVFDFPPKGHVALCVYDEENDQWIAWRGNDTGLIHVSSGVIYQGDVLAESYTHASAAGGIHTYSIQNTTGGYVWIIESLFLINETSNCGPCWFGVLGSGVEHHLAHEATLNAKIPLLWSGRITVAFTQHVQVYWAGLTAGDILKASIRGYKMRASQV